MNFTPLKHPRGVSALVFGAVLMVGTWGAADTALAEEPHSAAVAPSARPDVSGEEASMAGAQSGATDSAGMGSAGMRAYIDPETGKLSSSPPAGSLGGSARSTGATAPVVFVRSGVPGGGQMVDVSRHAMSFMSAGVGSASGKVTTECRQPGTHSGHVHGGGVDE